ncbi:MAG TPA: ribosome maturation factor RimM [Terriglobia bacterium]|nr:ribosome maturation factor RimM [Terriglobia bacterium]
MMRAPERGGMDGFVAIACVLRPQGRRGEVLAVILSDFPSRFENLSQAFLDQPAQPPVAVTVEDAWFHKDKVVLKFSGVDSIDDAESLKGRYVLIPEGEKFALPAGQFYLWELEGCRVVVETDGKETTLGTVTSIERTGGVDLLHVAGSSHEILIPMAESICKRIDPANKLIVVDPPADLLDLNLE